MYVHAHKVYMYSHVPHTHTHTCMPLIHMSVCMSSFLFLDWMDGWIGRRVGGVKTSEIECCVHRGQNCELRVVHVCVCLWCAQIRWRDAGQGCCCWTVAIQCLSPFHAETETATCRRATTTATQTADCAHGQIALDAAATP